MFQICWFCNLLLGANQIIGTSPTIIRKGRLCTPGLMTTIRPPGWWSTVDERAKHHVRSYFGVDGNDISWTLIRAALASSAKTAIFPLQDVLGLGSRPFKYACCRTRELGVADGAPHRPWNLRTTSWSCSALWSMSRSYPLVRQDASPRTIKRVSLTTTADAKDREQNKRCDWHRRA